MQKNGAGDVFQGIFSLIEQETKQYQVEVLEAETRLNQAQEILESLRQRKETLKTEVGKHADLVMKSDPKKMEEITRQHAATLGELPINAEQIRSYEELLIPALEKALKDVQATFGDKINAIVIGAKAHQNAELNDEISRAEEIITIWEKTIGNIKSKYHPPFSADLSLTWKNDLVYHSCADYSTDQSMARARLAASYSLHTKK